MKAHALHTAKHADGVYRDEHLCPGPLFLLLVRPLYHKWKEIGAGQLPP